MLKSSLPLCVSFYVQKHRDTNLFVHSLFFFSNLFKILCNCCCCFFRRLNVDWRLVVKLAPKLEKFECAKSRDNNERLRIMPINSSICRTPVSEQSMQKDALKAVAVVTEGTRKARNKYARAFRVAGESKMRGMSELIDLLSASSRRRRFATVGGVGRPLAPGMGSRDNE